MSKRPASARSVSSSSTTFWCSSALRRASSSRSREMGFSRKSRAPSWVALTAVSMVPWPDIMMMGRSGLSARMRSSAAMPSRSGIFTSITTASTGRASSTCSASRPVWASSVL